MEFTPRLHKIATDIETFVKDAEDDGYHDGHHDGFDEGWGEGRDKGYDDGWEDACQYILDKYLTENRWVITPESQEEFSSLMEIHADNTAMCMMIMQNWMTVLVREMKVNKA